MKTKLDEQLAAAPRHWLKGLSDWDVREDCREQFKEWCSEKKLDDEQVRVTLQLWRNILSAQRR